MTNKIGDMYAGGAGSTEIWREKQTMAEISDEELAELIAVYDKQRRRLLLQIGLDALKGEQQKRASRKVQP